MTRTALFVRWVLGVCAAVFLGLGVAYLFIPKFMIGGVSLEAGSPTAMADVRSTYGGLNLAFGVILTVCFLRKHWSAGLSITTLAATCLAAGRLIGILLDPAKDILTYGLFASEVLAAVLSAVAWFLARQPEPVVTVVASTPAVRTETAPVANPAESTPEV